MAIRDKETNLRKRWDGLIGRETAWRTTWEQHSIELNPVQSAMAQFAQVSRLFCDAGEGLLIMGSPYKPRSFNVASRCRCSVPRSLARSRYGTPLVYTE